MADPEVLRAENRGTSKGRLTRRKLMRSLLAGAGTGIAVPVAVSNSSAAGRTATGMAMPTASHRASPSAPWRPLFLDEHQNATLIALSETIAPGSRKAEVNRFIDLFLSVLPPDSPQSFATGNSVPQGTTFVPAPARQRLFDALGAFDAEARRRYGLTFIRLSETQQMAVLSDASQPPSEPRISLAERGHSIPSVEQGTLYGHFLDLRNWVIGGYYSTAAGIREMGWTGNAFFPSYPGCKSSS
jgi:hypothetical protein